MNGSGNRRAYNLKLYQSLGTSFTETHMGCRVLMVRAVRNIHIAEMLCVDYSNNCEF